jgi:hypothetical protein
MLSLWVPVYGLTPGRRSRRRTGIWPAPVLETLIGSELFYRTRPDESPCPHSPHAANTASAAAGSSLMRYTVCRLSFVALAI